MFSRELSLNVSSHWADVQGARDRFPRFQSLAPGAIFVGTIYSSVYIHRARLTCAAKASGYFVRLHEVMGQIQAALKASGSPGFFRL